MAIIGENQPLVKAESYATVLARMVMDVVVLVVEHKAEPLQERVQPQMKPVRAVAFVAALEELLVQVGIIRLIGLNIVYCCPVNFSIGAHLSQRNIELKIPVPVVTKALHAIFAQEVRPVALWCESI